MHDGISDIVTKEISNTNTLNYTKGQTTLYIVLS